MFRFLSILGCIVFVFQTSVAQRLEQFSADHGDFQKEVKELFGSINNESVKEMYENFEDAYKANQFLPEEVDMIIVTGSKMLGQKLTATNQLKTYFGMLPSMKNGTNAEQEFKQWHQVTDQVLDNIENRKFKMLNDWLDFSNDFFIQGKAIHYSKGGTNWLTKTDTYVIDFVEGKPILKFSKLDLIAKIREDSTVIEQTAGTFYPTEGVWNGQGGKVTWARFEGMENVVAALSDYEIEVKTSLYEADSVKLTYPLYLGAIPTLGSFSDKVSVGNRARESSFPRFTSYQQEIEIKNIGTNIRLFSGFRLQGTTIYGFGTEGTPAKILIYDESKPVFRGLAETFAIKREERVVGERVESVVFFDADSLYHPSVNFRYDIEEKRLSLSRGERGSDRNPFFSSYHGFNIDAERINCYLDRDSIFIGEQTVAISKGSTPVVFESLNFFDEGEYRRIQNIASVNPIAVMKKVFDEDKEYRVDANYLASQIDPNFTVENIKSLLYDLVADGFINFFEEDNEIELKDKVFHYANASTKKVDYDVLKIKSRSEETNAVFDLKSKEMKTSGVKQFEFSEKQKVGVLLPDESLTLKNNRNIEFAGRLFAGLTVLTGDEFNFNYEKFLIELDSTDYFDVFIPTGNLTKTGDIEATSIASRIENVSGTLLIDAPKNKSGREDIPMFPSLQSKGDSYVYYESPLIQDSTYLRDSFYFAVAPFSFNSLDRYSPSDISFDGKLVSAMIFPDFKETLRLQEDKSLGFTTQSPAEGYPNYSGKGNYKGSISLSHDGLLGKGSISYLGAVLNSEDIVFRPKLATASAEEFNLEEVRNATPEVPQVRGQDVTIEWVPYVDSMYVRSKEAPFEFYKEGNHQMEGVVILTPDGVRGRGDFEWSKAMLNSELFSFGAFAVDSDTLDLKIRALSADAIALETTNLNGKVDFDTQKASFKANDEVLNTLLPYNQYQTTMNEFDWDMANETITFKAKAGELGSFKSTHPDQDSLFFEGETAFYDLKTNDLRVGGVPYIVSADAFVYPNEGKVQLQAGGVMATLENARIIADTVSKYHVINRATVEIKGKKDFTAKGFYEYNIAGKVQEIEFTDIVGQRVGKGASSEKNVATRANGEVTEKDGFYIDDKTEFRGTIGLFSEKPNLTFDGYARLDAPFLSNREWFSVDFEGDKNDLVIKYDTPKNYDGEPLEVGFFVSRETSLAYSRIMMPLYLRKDRQIMPVKGIFKYDEDVNTFIFGDSLKVSNPTTLVGNILKYNNTDNTVYGEGSINLCDSIKHISVKAAGSITSAFETLPLMDTTQVDPSAMVDIGKLDVNAMAGIKLILPDDLLKIVANDFKASGFDAVNIDYTKEQDSYKQSFGTLFADQPKISQTVNNLALGTADIPKEINDFTFLLGNTDLRWEPQYQSFVSTKAKIPLVSIGGEMINKQVGGFVEYRMPSNMDDRFYILLRSPSDFFYFFGYKQGVLNVVSSNPKFTDELLSMKEKDLIYKLKGDDFYEIQASDPSTATRFINRIKAVTE